MRALGSLALAAVLGALASSVSGCTTDAFCFSCGNEGKTSSTTSGSGGGATGSGGDGTGGNLFVTSGPTGSGGSGAPDASADACASTDDDPFNCGSCGNVCNLTQAFPKCEGGECKIDHCAPGHLDLNGIASDGCEYTCSPTNGGVEICDGIDNDCNGVIDDGFDLTSDTQNCGACGNACNLANATAKCTPVAGVPTCVIDTCADGFKNLDSLDADGCEYTCPVWPPVAELCNDKDDNCDGNINEGNPEGGQPCQESCPGGVCKGECTAGTTLCAGSVLTCVPGKGPSIEVCNGLDDDCDGVVDNGFDLKNDPLNCGTCGHVCDLKNAIGGCTDGKCVIRACQPGFNSIDGNDDNGCEYACPVNPPTVETCNGKDDDCDGVVDNPTKVAAQKPAAAGCNPKPGTPCAGADFTCQGDKGWRCNYGPDVEVDASGKLAVVETKCDGKDGNCNGQIDEAFSDLGSSCDNGKLGACRDMGQRVCDPADNTKTKCDLSFPPDAVPGAPSAETCNGVDDDCDGVVDNGITDDMVLVTVGTTKFYIDRYEASRPDASSMSPGLNEARRCVNADVIPWTFATQAEAAAACASTGDRLCTAAEITTACAGTAGNAYPYGMSYQPLTCNGLDFDGKPGGADDDVILPTGSPLITGCVTSTGIHDLSGNVAEWTSTVTGNTGAPKNLSIYEAMGGSYKTPAIGLSCQFSLSRYASNAILPELGFRCCRDAP